MSATVSFVATVVDPSNPNPESVPFSLSFEGLDTTGDDQSQVATAVAALQAQIAALTALVNQLLAQLGGGVVTPPTPTPGPAAAFFAKK